MTINVAEIYPNDKDLILATEWTYYMQMYVTTIMIIYSKSYSINDYSLEKFTQRFLHGVPFLTQSDLTGYKI